MGYGWQLSARNQDGIVYLTYSQSAKKACHCEPVRRLAWQSVTNNVKFPIYYADLRHLDYGFPRRFALLCCGSQNFHAAFRRALEILTAATRSPRCICHRQRSDRSQKRHLNLRFKNPRTLYCVSCRNGSSFAV